MSRSTAAGAGAAPKVGFLARLFGRNPRNDPAASPPVRDPLVQLVDLQAHIAGKVPPAVAARVERIATTVRHTMPRLGELGLGSEQAYTVVATATSYLPEALGAYLRLPRPWADKRPVSGAKTSLMVLCDQLDLLAYKMDEISDAISRADADALIAHGRFLAEKFGTSSLTAGPPGGPMGGPT